MENSGCAGSSSRGLAAGSRGVTVVTQMTARTRVTPVDFHDLAGDEEAPIYAVDDGDPEALATADHRRPSVSRARRLREGCEVK